MILKHSWWLLGYSRKIQRGIEDITFYKRNLDLWGLSLYPCKNWTKQIFLYPWKIQHDFFLITPRNPLFTLVSSGQNKALLLEILGNCVTPFDQLWKLHFFFSWPLEFHHDISSISQIIPFPQPPPPPMFVLKPFPGPGYLRSKDGVIWLWHLLVNLYIYICIYIYIYYIYIYIIYVVWSFWRGTILKGERTTLG